jgi:bla regulator protein blaR1
MTNDMNWLVSMGLINAALATLLATLAWAVARYGRQPALAHVLWVVVLLKLLTPPLVEIPVGWKLDIAWVRPGSLADFALVQEFDQRSTNSETSLTPGGERSTLVSEGAQFFGVAGGEIHAKAVPPTVTQSGLSGIRQSATATTTNTPTFRRSGLASGLLTMMSATISWLPVIWMCGAAIRGCVLLRRTWAFHVFVRRAGSIDRALSQRAHELAQRAGLTTAPQVITVQGAVSPMLWGVGGRVRLIFPARLARELDPIARDALLLHELAHYSRGDQWVRLVELAAEVVYWWHPVTWWARHEIEVAEEQCCDAWVVERLCGSRRTYAEALLATIDFLCEQPAVLPPAASGLGDVPLLKIRLTQIMCGDLAARLSTSATIGVLLVAMFILPVGPALFAASVQPKRLPRQAKVAVPSATSSELSAAAGLDIPKGDVASGSNSSSTSGSPLYASLTAAVRPPTLVTATAVSRNGKYRLERRKGSHVTLVNQAIDWRLDMSTHGIVCVAFTPDSRLFVTGHEDGLVRVWDSETGGLVSTLRGCSDAVWSVAVSPPQNDEYQVAAGTKDGAVLVWELGSGEEVARLAPSASSVSCLRWSPNGDKLAISFGDFSDRDEDGVLVWSPLDNVFLAQTALDRPVAAVAWLGDGRVLVADWTGNAQVWQTKDESPYYSMTLGRNGKQIVEAAHWSADCALISAALAEELGAGAQ